MRTTLVVGAALVLGACGPPPEAAVRRAPEPPFIVGATLRLADGRSITLAASAASAPHGWLSPVAVPSPDGQQVAYRTWSVGPDGTGRPALRVRDLRTGADTVLADGAASVAWGADGRIAYAAGGDDRPTARWSGQIVVQGSAAPEPWTTDRRRYVVVAWAGPRLLAYELDRVGRPSLFVLDGPSRGGRDQRRSLGSGVLVALSPDGSRAFLADTADTATPHVRVVVVGTGAVLARLDVPGIAVGHAGDWSTAPGRAASGPAAGAALRPAGGAGSGPAGGAGLGPPAGGAASGAALADRVVAAAWPAPVVFEVGAGTILVGRRLNLDPAKYPVGLREPRLAGGTVIGWAAVDTSQDPPTALIRCSIESGNCTAGPTYPPPTVHPATNPSRPLR